MFSEFLYQKPLFPLWGLFVNVYHFKTPTTTLRFLFLAAVSLISTLLFVVSLYSLLLGCSHCPAEAEGKSLLLKTPQTYHTGFGWLDLKACFLWSNFHTMRKYYVCCQEMEAILHPTCSLTAMNHKDGFPKKYLHNLETLERYNYVILMCWQEPPTTSLD